MSSRSFSVRCISFWAIFASVFALVALLAQPVKAGDREDISIVFDKYVKALYARDFRAAYEQISSADQRLKDVHSYSRERGEFRVCHSSVQPDHVHLVVEAGGKEALGWGM